MNEKEIHDELKTIRGALVELQREVTAIGTKLNGGPGHTLFCRQQSERMQKLEGSVEVLKRAHWTAYGILVALVFLVNLFGPALRSKLGLP